MKSRKNRRRDPSEYGQTHLVMEKVGCHEAAYDVVEIDPVHHETIRTVAKNVSEREAEMMISRRDPPKLRGHKPQGPAHQTRSDKSTLLKYSKYLPAGSMLLFGPLPGLLQSYALQKMKPHFLAAVRKQLISRFHYSPSQADHALVRWADAVTEYRKSAIEIAKEIVRIETGKMGDVFVRDPAKKRTKKAGRTMKKKSKKFERCVLGVKKKRSSVNPWAVCHAALGKKAYARDPKRKASGAKRLSKFPIQHSDGTPDRRFTITSEYTGHVNPQWVARFQGHWIGSSITREGAIKLAMQDWEEYQRAVSGGRDPNKKARKTRDLYVLQGNYGYGHGWEDLTAATTRKEIVGYRKDYRENEPGTPLRILHKQERIQLRLPGVRDPGHKKKPGKKRHSRAVMALAKKYAQTRVKRSRS